MAEVFVRRGAIAWSKWNVARVVIEGNLDRAGIRTLDGAWVDTGDGLRYVGSPSMCEAIAVALEGLGLAIELSEGVPAL